ncbi:flavodoxin domain-containing protein [Nakamurella sp. GG22]
MTTVLVAFAGKMGGTREIGIAIGEELHSVGLTVHVGDAREVFDLDGFDAVVIGSALYTGRWRPEAVRLLENVTSLRRPIRVFLFQSGPCGPDARTQQVPAPKRVGKLADAAGVGLPVTFGGRLEPATARGFLAKKMAEGPIAGDFRDFDRIRQYARTIATELKSVEAVDI